MAKSHQKKHEWKKAVNYFKEYMEKTEGHCDDGVYVSYAKCLIRLGYTNQAQDVLIKGKSRHPDSEPILKELYELYIALNEKESAKSTAQSLVEINPERSDYYFLLGKANATLNKIEEAKKFYVTGLEYKHGITISELINTVQSGFAENLNEVSSEYSFISGRNNYGSLIHDHQGKKYLTKIANYNLLAKREEIFYKEVCAEFPVLYKYVPKYVDSKVIDNVLYLTIVMIESKPISIENVSDVVKVSQKISSIPYKEINEKHPNLNYSFQLKNKPNPMTFYFTQIHQKHYNKQLFEKLYKLIEQNKYPDSVREIIQRLEQLIMDHYLYTFINPEDHYSLIHGDFNKSNSKLNMHDETVVVFDWETFKIGLHNVDIARYFSGLMLPYSYVKENYLDDDALNNNLSLIEKIFFVYALVLLYILTIREKKIEIELDKYVTPALNDLEVLVNRFIESEPYMAFQSLIQNKEENILKIHQLNDEILELQKKIKGLESRHEKIVNSKSWKAKEPFEGSGKCSIEKDDSYI